MREGTDQVDNTLQRVHLNIRSVTGRDLGDISQVTGDHRIWLSQNTQYHVTSIRSQAGDLDIDLQDVTHFTEAQLADLTK